MGADAVIVIGWTHEIPEETSAAILGFPHVLADVSGGETFYFNLLASWWASTEPDVLVIEHDIVVDEAAIHDLLDCPYPWCPAWYPFEGGEIYGLGCTKFSLPIRQAVPDALEQVGRIDQSPVHPPKHWCSMDAWLQGVLMTAGQSPHLHRANVRHTGTRRSHVACR
jgi:hypothetical protein